MTLDATADEGGKESGKCAVKTSATLRRVAGVTYSAKKKHHAAERKPAGVTKVTCKWRGIHFLPRL